MATLLSPGDQIKCWKIVEYLSSSNALSYVAEYVPGNSDQKTAGQLDQLMWGIPEGFDPKRDKVFLKQFVDPGYHDAILKPFVRYQNRIQRKINSCWKKCNCFCRELDSFICDVPGKRGYYQVQELFPGNRSLKVCLEKNSLQWKELRFIARKMVYGLQLLHCAGIVHADLKPDNLLVVDNIDPVTKRPYPIPTDLRIIDFDSSLLVNEKTPRHTLSGNPGTYRYRGTEQYLSPEHFTGNIPVPASDIFTTGIILCEMLSPDGHPFPYTHEEYRKAVREGKCNLKKLRCRGGQSVVKAIKACFSMNPEDRPTAEQLLSELTLPEAV